jgi:hypothetical protein
MLKMKTSQLLLIILPVLAGCSSAQIFSDYDRSADFKSYKSYAWLQQSDSTEDLHYNNQLTEKNLKHYANNEMAARGYSIDIHNPDLLIEYHTEIQKKQQVVSNPVYSNPPNYYPGYGRYRYNPGYTYNTMPYISGYTTQVIDYNEGTLVINVIDRKQHQLIWSGWSVGTVSDEQSLSTQVERDIKRIFRKYPIIAPKKK